MFHELIRDPARFAEVVGHAAPRVARRLPPAGQRAVAIQIGLRYGARDDDAADRARVKVLAAVDRLEAELGSGDHLAGDAFSVADLTAAALLYPLVRPPEAYVTLQRMPERVEQLRAELSDRRGYRWVQEMFRRHRRPPSEAPRDN